MADNFDIKKFLTENKVFWNPNADIKESSILNENNLREKIRDMVIAELSDKELEDATIRAEKGDSTDLTLHMAGIKEYEDEEDMSDYFFDIDTPEEELGEAKKKKKEEEEVEDIEVTDTEEFMPEDDMSMEDTSMRLDSGEKEIMNSLETALEFAKQKGDEKLIDQIGNTITFFTRQYIVK
jgi:hypothetical protein